MAVPNPNKAELFTIIQDAVRIANKLLTAQTIPADAGTLETSTGGKSDFSAAILAGAAAFESTLARTFIAGGAGLLTFPFVSLVHHEINESSSGLDAALARIYRWMVDNTERVQSRGHVFDKTGTPGAGNVGTGAVRRLVVDEEGFALEAQHADDKKLRVVADAQTGRNVERHREPWEFNGENAPRSAFGFGAETGSGAIIGGEQGDVRTRGPADSLQRNAEWGQPQKTDPAAPAEVAFAASDTLTGWEVTSGVITSLALDNTVAKLYVNSEGETNPQALVFNGNVTIEQNLNENNIKLDGGTPYDWGIAIRRESSCDGTFSDKLGAITNSVVVTTLTNDLWTLLLPTLDKNLWPKNLLNVADPVRELKLTGRTTGKLRVGFVRLSRGHNLGGTFFWPWTGATRWKLNDSVSFADALAGPEGIIQKLLFLFTGRMLPSAPKAPTAASTLALAGVGAGNVDNGAHTYAVTFVDKEDQESAVSPTAAITVADKTVNGQVDLSVIPTGTAAIAKRKVYRSTAGTTTPLKLLTTINDNVTTTFRDNVADAGLGANAPNGVTLADPS